MQDTNIHLPKTQCPVCGKVTPKRDVRDKKPQFCSRICAGMSKFQTRYRGTNAGPFDQPVNIMTKAKWGNSKGDGLVSDIPEGA